MYFCYELELSKFQILSNGGLKTRNYNDTSLLPIALKKLSLAGV